MILNAADLTYESDGRCRRGLNTRNEIIAFHSPSVPRCPSFHPRERERERQRETERAIAALNLADREFGGIDSVQRHFCVLVGTSFGTRGSSMIELLTREFSPQKN